MSASIYDRAVTLGPPPPVHLTPSGVAVGRGRLALSVEQLSRIEPFHIDGFAGGGGASEGYYLATGRHADMAWNHDKEALAMHRANHPFTKHFQEDIRRVEWAKIIRRLVTSAWFSPDCKDFSKAKGGKPKSKRIRGLAWTIIHMINELGPLAPLWLFMENVEEWAGWCPLLPDGTRNPELIGLFLKCITGALYRRGYTNLEWAQGDGYVYRRTWAGIERRPDITEFSSRACDHSRAPTIRKRLYLVANRIGQPISWPGHDFGEGRPNRQGIAADVLDFSLPCPSIFMTRKQARAFTKRTGIKIQRPLAKNSMQRFADGVERYVMNDPAPFFVSYAQQGGENRSGGAPVHTLTASAKDQNQVVAVHVAKMTSGGVGSAARAPFPTITANSFKKRPGGNPPLGVVSTFLAQQNFGDKPNYSPAGPVRAIVAGGGHEALAAVFLAQNNGGMVGHRADDAVSTINGKGANQSVVALGLAAYFETPQDPRLNEGMHTITTKDRYSLFTAQLEIPVLTPELAKKARRVARWLRSHGVKVEGEFAMCGEFVIVDVGMRMLTARELYRAQGFGEDYIIDFGFLEDGTRISLTKTAQVKMCGNSVCPPMAEVLFRLNLPNHYVMKEAA
jgi:DNA (cytosine-5)-methyltransferase 1